MSVRIDTGNVTASGGVKKSAEVQHDNKVSDTQQSELISKEGSSAVRSSALGGIKLHRTMTVTQGGKDYRIEGKYRVVNDMPTEEANMFWSTQGYKDMPYKEGQIADIIQLTEDARFVRTYDGKSSGKAGSWVMRYEDIEGLTPEQIADKFALPQVPKYICDVELKEGTCLRTGECNPLYGFKGGGQQFDLMGVRTGTFVNEREIGTAAK